MNLEIGMEATQKHGKHLQMMERLKLITGGGEAEKVRGFYGEVDNVQLVPDMAEKLSSEPGNSMLRAVKAGTMILLSLVISQLKHRSKLLYLTIQAS